MGVGTSIGLWVLVVVVGISMTLDLLSSGRPRPSSTWLYTMINALWQAAVLALLIALITHGGHI